MSYDSSISKKNIKKRSQSNEFETLKQNRYNGSERSVSSRTASTKNQSSYSTPLFIPSTEKDSFSPNQDFKSSYEPLLLKVDTFANDNKSTKTFQNDSWFTAPSALSHKQTEQKSEQKQTFFHPFASTNTTWNPSSSLMHKKYDVSQNEKKAKRRDDEPITILSDNGRTNMTADEEESFWEIFRKEIGLNNKLSEKAINSKEDREQDEVLDSLYEGLGFYDLISSSKNRPVSTTALTKNSLGAQTQKIQSPTSFLAPSLVLQDSFVPSKKENEARYIPSSFVKRANDVKIQEAPEKTSILKNNNGRSLTNNKTILSSDELEVLANNKLRHTIPQEKVVIAPQLSLPQVELEKKEGYETKWRKEFTSNWKQGKGAQEVLSRYNGIIAGYSSPELPGMTVYFVKNGFIPPENADNALFVVDDGGNAGNPNFQIVDSYRIGSTSQVQAVSELIHSYAQEKYPGKYTKTVNEMVDEWIGHNVLYALLTTAQNIPGLQDSAWIQQNINRARSADLDVNESKMQIFEEASAFFQGGEYLYLKMKEWTEFLKQMSHR